METKLFRNMGDSNYFQAVFAKYRKPFKRKERTLQKGNRMIMEQPPYGTPCMDKLFKWAKAIRVRSQG